jgi:hypothetical protein
MKIVNKGSTARSAICGVYSYLVSIAAAAPPNAQATSHRHRTAAEEAWPQHAREHGAYAPERAEARPADAGVRPPPEVEPGQASGAVVDSLGGEPGVQHVRVADLVGIDRGRR